MKRRSTFEVPRVRRSCVALASRRLLIDTGNLGPHWGKRIGDETRSPYLQIQFSIFGISGDLVHKCSVELAITAKSVTLITLASHFFELSVTY